MKMLDARAARAARSVLDGATAFTLYDTFGFPFDLTADVCRERGVSGRRGRLREGDERAARARARGEPVQGRARSSTTAGRKTAFHGYDTLSHEGRVTALYRDGVAVQSLVTGEPASSSSTRRRSTPSRADRSATAASSRKGGACLTLFAVDDTQKIQADVFGHLGEVKTGELRVGDTVAAEVDHAARARTVRNHSATHLMHKALREVLGPHVQQKGSLVDPDKTRFDFAHNAPMTDEEIRRVEQIVNREIQRQCRDGGARDADRRSEEVRRDDAVRRKVRRRSPRARHRHVARAVRRHARRAHRRHRFLQDRRRRRRRGRHPARRGGHRRRRAQVGAGAGSGASMPPRLR